MTDNGSFRKKAGFTIAGNGVVRDTKLSMKAKGLYILIMSYITMENLQLTKTLLQKKCFEGTKAFNSAWDDLKEAGYLKVHMKPGGKRGWQVEYELLDEAQGGAHTLYYSRNGDVTNTNLSLSRVNSISDSEKQDTPQNGIYANGSIVDGTCAGGTYVHGNNAQGGNNIRPPCKTANKTFVNTQSFNPCANAKITLSEGMSEDEIREIVEDDLLDDTAIPFSYSSDKNRMLIAIKTVSDWYELPVSALSTVFHKEVFDLLVDCLTEMACEVEVRTYRGASVTCANVIEKINSVLKNDGSLYGFVMETVDDYVSGASKNEITAEREYMKAVIWTSFTTYRVKAASLFARTYEH